MGTPEDSALHGLRVSVGHILDNFGFTQISDDSLEVLSDIMKRFIKKLATNGKMYAEHAGRNSLSSDDLCCAFKKMKYSTPDLYQFIAQNNLNAPPKAMPRFPVPRTHSRPLYHPQPSDKELETRPEHIPEFYQAAHPEWTRDGADYLAVMKPSTSTDKKGAAPDFPSFLDFSSKDLGISKGDRRPAPPPLIRSDESSATGIRSSANISSMKLNSYDHPAPLPLFKRKTKPPFNGMKDSRSSTPIGRSHSPYGFFDRSESMRTESPSTSKEDKPKLKPRPSLKAETKVDSPIPPLIDEGGSSPMPTLELIEGYTKNEAHDLPLTPRRSDSDTNEFDVDDSVVAANKILFEKLKAEQERQLQKRNTKDKENEERQRKKEETKRKKEEKKREQERQKKEKEERERQRRKEEEARLERERKEAIEKERKELEDRQRKEKVELERRRAAETATPPMRMAEQETPLSLKLVISNPMSSNASSAFSPPSVKPTTIFETTSTSAAVNGEDDSDTIPFVEGVAAVNGATEFPLNISTSAAETSTPSKKKHKKKDKERDRSASPHKKKHKKDKEHKKKKKEKRERDEREKHKKKDKHRDSKEATEQVLKVPTLKIRLGDQTPSENDASSSTSNHETRLTFKNLVPDNDKVPPLRTGTPSNDTKPAPEKAKFIKAELKTPPAKTLTEKEEKQRRREERKRREREEAQKRQKEELERFQREHEEKQRKEAEEKRRREEELKKAEEAEERRRKEREQKERDQREREERERREKEKDAARKEKEKERERQRKESLLTPIVAHISADPVLKKKHKKEKREREEREREEREREKERQRAREKEKEEKKKEEEIAAEEPEVWICPVCSVAWAEGASMVACDTCNNWFHWACVGIEQAPDEATSWFCKKCIKKNAKRKSMPTGGGPPKKKKKSEGHEYFK